MALDSMGRQGGNSITVGGGGGSSSIVLLQERFRQLQKMRERREEMELLRLFPGPEKMGQTDHYESPATSLVHPEMIFHKPTTTTTTTTTTTRPCLQDSLSLGLDLYTKQPEPQSAKTPLPSTDFWSVDSATVSMLRTYDKPEVDTSLHL